MTSKARFRYDSPMKISCRRIRIGGIVQGVGFRPFVYTLARECSLSGFVRNDAAGVEILLEGAPFGIDAFLARFQKELPPLARVDTFDVHTTEQQGFKDFRIFDSDAAAAKSAVVSPDIALCANCLADLRDPENRRFRHPFITCTDCGPRYSILRTVPYDRPNTSMATFEMCPECRAEYEDPSNRRYHAQPISCHACGPRLYFHQNGAKTEGEQAFSSAIDALKAGRIVAVKGLGGFHLMCDATNEEAVATLRERKRRPAKPFAVMFKDLDAIKHVAQVGGAEAALIVSKEKPIVIVRRNSQGELAPSVAPGIDRLGVFLPYTPLHVLLFDQIDFALVATSANLSDEPILRDGEALRASLGHVVDAVLDHDRPIVNACDDSVMQVANEQPLTLRLARGFAPLTLNLPVRTPHRILAVGGNQKNALALAFEDKIVMSPHIGDLGSPEAFDYFERTVETFKRFYDFEPDIIVCDRHPGYETTKWAKGLKIKNEKLKVVEVQHHRAHVYAGMAEFGINGPLLAFAFDGTGYGDDGTIWGGEVFLAEGTKCERIASLRPFSLLGGEKAVREPRRAALGLLFECMALEEVLALDSPAVGAFTPEEIRLLYAGWSRGVNAPRTSSMGRLFDAVAALSGICRHASFEGESGLLLEAAVSGAQSAPYPLPQRDGVMDWEPMLKELLSSNSSPDTISSRFINTLVEMMTTLAKSHKRPVLLTGGVFQNRTLLERTMKRFEDEGIVYYLPTRFPVNDGGIALGQIYFALHCQ